MTGLHPREVADLDEDEYLALVEAAKAKYQLESWGNAHEQRAAIVEALWAILSRLEAGIGTVTVEKTSKVADRGEYPRPQHIQDQDDANGADPDELVFTSVADAMRTLLAKRG